MKTNGIFCAVCLACLSLAHSVSAQATPPSPGYNPGNTQSPTAAPVFPPSPLATEPASATITSTATAVTPVAPLMDPKTAVQSVLAMFTINLAVNLDSTGKPLPATGAWGAQTQFPAGPPRVCAQARIPCVKVIYRVPEQKIICEWTLGLVNAVEPQPDGTIKHALHQLVLDENDAAATYTMRKAWSAGENRPTPTSIQRPDYPAIARNAGVGGVVVVRLVVGPDGLIKSAAPLGGPALLQPPVLDAVRRWKFDPLAIGQQPTSFQIDEQFAYNAGKTNTFADMDPSGKVMLEQTDPHLEPGFHSNGASSGSWAACSAVTCAQAAPSTPK